MTEGSRDRQREQFQQFVDDWSQLANRLVTTSSGFAKRVIRQGVAELPGTSRARSRISG